MTKGEIGMKYALMFDCCTVILHFDFCIFIFRTQVRPLELPLQAP